MKIIMPFCSCLFFYVSAFAQFSSSQNEKIFIDEKNFKNKELKSVEQWITDQSVLRFEENKGQLADADGNPANDILFKAASPGANIYITAQGLSWQFFKSEEKEKSGKK